MTTITGKFIQDILKKNGKTIVDEEILSEAEKIINEEMIARRMELKKNIKEDKGTILVGQTTEISGVMEAVLLKALKKLGKTEIDKDVLAEVEKMMQDERSVKREILKKIIKDH